MSNDREVFNIFVKTLQLGQHVCNTLFSTLSGSAAILGFNISHPVPAVWEFGYWRQIESNRTSSLASQHLHCFCSPYSLLYAMSFASPTV